MLGSCKQEVIVIDGEKSSYYSDDISYKDLS